MSLLGEDPHEPVHAAPVTRRNDVQTGDEAETAGSSNISGDDADSVSEVSGSGSEALQSVDRPNKYRGPPSTWRSWTEGERKLAASLDQERAADLAIHLYNSHALKRRLWQSKGACTVQGWRSKERWHQLQASLGTETVGDGQDAFIPQKGWTAWPMKPDLVPRAGEGVPQSSSHEVEGNWKHQSRGKIGVPRSSEVLRDCIFGGLLGVAKEKYKERGGDHTQRDNERESCSPSGSSIHTPSPSPSKGRESLAPNDSTVVGGREGRHDSVSRYLSAPRPGLIPMADDEEAYYLLQPIAHHLLSKLDSLLMGLHHAREAHLALPNEKGLSGAQKHLEVDLPATPGRVDSLGRLPTLKDHTRSTKEGKGRPPKDQNVLDDSVLASSDRKGKARRPRKQLHRTTRMLTKDSQAKPDSPLDPTENVSDSDHPVENESGSSLYLSDGISENSPPSSEKRRVTGNPTAKTRHRFKKQRQLGLRDWSDILGVASMVGWEPEAISRAAARCSTLFGEGINFRTLAEEETFLREGRIAEYRPGGTSPPVRNLVEARPFEREHKPTRNYPQHIQLQIDSVRVERTQPKGQWSSAEDSLLCDLKSTLPLSWSKIATH
ncbi:hypothetical protein GP486_004952, partial [Trichoglossum hirsutum]